MSQAGRALAYAFETGALAPQRAFFLRAELIPFKDIDAEQSFRPEYLRLKRAGWSVVPRIERGGYPLGQLLLTKHSYTDRQDITSGGKPLLVAPKQHEARKQALKDGVPEARAEGHRS